MRSHILTEDGKPRLVILVDDGALGVMYVIDLHSEKGVRLSSEAWQQVREFVDGDKAQPVEVQPPQHVKEQIEMEMDGEFEGDDLRYVVYNDAHKGEWLNSNATEQHTLNNPPRKERVANCGACGWSGTWRELYWVKGRDRSFWRCPECYSDDVIVSKGEYK